jgi:glycosyltransferase involved in cell wall biosynthesis
MRPRVLHIDFSGYGVMTHVLSILDHADHDAREHCVIFATDDRRPGVDSYRAELDRRGIPYWTVPVRQNITPEDIFAVIKTLGLIQKIKPTVVHCHSTKAGAVGRVCARICGLPAVFTPHSFSFQMAEPNSRKRNVLVAIERFLGQWTDRIAAVSDTERNLAVDEKICPEARVATIPNGVDLGVSDVAVARRRSIRESLQMDEDQPVVCFIGRFAPQKMPHLVVEAAEWLRNRNCKPTFWMMGNGPLEDEIKELVTSRGLDDQFKWLGWQAYNEALAYLAASDVMLLPSRYEGLPYVALEAQAVGTVPILTLVPGSQDAVVPDETGILVPFNDVPAIGDAVMRLIASPDVRRKLACAGREHVNRHFNAAQMVRSIEGLYDDILRERATRRVPRQVL